MTTDRTDIPPLEEPLAELERRIIDEYIRGLGQDPDHLRASMDHEARKIVIVPVALC